MNSKRLKIAVIAVIIILIITIVLIIKLVSLNKNKDQITEETIQEIENNVVEENTVENIIEANNGEEEKIIENIVVEENNEKNKEEIINTTVADPEQEIDKETFQKNENDLEKAINIVKKDWGEDEKVYFSYETNKLENGKYRIYVKDSDTTHTLRTYDVDVETGKFNIEE